MTGKATRAALAVGTLGVALSAQTATAAVVKTETRRLIVAPTSAPPGQPLPADPGEKNTITITQAAGGFVITDATAPLTVASATCTLNAAPGAIPSQVTCAAVGIDHLSVRTGDGDDSITNSTSLPGILDGGNGRDIVRGDSGHDVLIGALGSDDFYASGADTVYTQGRESNYAGSQGVSRVYCAAGNTATVYATRNDVVAPECKNVVRVTQGAPPVPAEGGAPAPAAGGGSGSGGAAPAPGGPAGAPPATVARVSSQVRIVAARVIGRRLRVTATSASANRALLRLVVSARVGRRSVTFSRGVHSAGSGGRYGFIVALGPRVRRAGRLTVAVRYLGDGAHLPQTARRVLLVRRK